MARHAQYPAVGRNIEPARRARYNVMALEFFGAPAVLTAIAVAVQAEFPQLSPAPPVGFYSHVTSPLFEINAARKGTGAGRRAA